MVGQEVVMGDWAPVEEGWEAVGEALRGRMAVFRGPKEAGDWARRAGRQGVGAAAGETMEGRRVGAVVGQGAVEVGEEKDPLGAEAKDDLREGSEQGKSAFSQLCSTHVHLQALAMM